MVPRSVVAQRLQVGTRVIVDLCRDCALTERSVRAWSVVAPVALPVVLPVVSAAMSDASFLRKIA